MQKYNYSPSASGLDSFKKKLTSEMFKSEPKFKDLDDALRHYDNDWESDGLELFRFQMPSKAGILK